MRVRPIARLLITLAFAATAATATAAPFCQVVTGPSPEPLVRQAAAELSGYLARLTDGPIPVVAEATGAAPAIVLQARPNASGLSDEEYFIEPSEDGQRVVIRGRTPLAVLHGAYRLLREYGIGFYFDGDAVPREPPAAFLAPRAHGSPAFSIRGSLPWYNFFDSPTTWDDQDFRFFADQIIRSGQNFIGFHSYDFEPFAAYEYDGKIVGGEPLMTTADRCWSTHPMRVEEFGFGTGRFFLGPYWGSDAAMMRGGREKRIAAQKALLRRGLEYASARGVKTCLGFEVRGDPTDVEEQRRFVARLTQLLHDYPTLDYVWLWEPEGLAVRGTAPPPLRSQAGRVFRDWREAFSYVGDPARMWEGMRVACYGRLAQQLVDRTTPSVRIVLSGWGGDHWLRVSDYFPAWDEALDKRIVFAALDDIRVAPTVSRRYKLPPDRERWAIPWYEYDGDQWFPQANAHVFAQTVRDAREKGCQGLLAIHWRTKEVAESQALVAQYAWNPEQTLQSFYEDYATRRVGPAQAKDLAAILLALDAMGYRWIGGPGQSECGKFAWCHVNAPEREEKLRQFRGRLERIAGTLGGDRSPSGALGRINDLITTIDRALLFNKVAGYLVNGGPVDRALKMDPADPKRRAECRRLLDKLTGPDFGDMLDLWARTITSRGELGVLATINAKAFYDFRAKIRGLQEACGEESGTRDLTKPDPRRRGIISDYQQTTIAARTPLVVRCVADDGARPARRVTLEYASDRRRAWSELRMRRLSGCVFEATLPAERVRPGWLRYRIRAELSDAEVTWPEMRGEPYRQVQVFPRDALVARRNEVIAEPRRRAEAVTLACKATDYATVQLAWTAGAGEVAIERRTHAEDPWARLGSTLDSQWEDAAAPPESDPAYRLVGSDGVVLATSHIRTLPAPAPTGPQRLSVRVRCTSARLAWAPGDLTVSRYSVERARSENGPWETATPPTGLTPQSFVDNVFLDRPPGGGTFFYRVRAHGFSPEKSSVGDVVRAEVLARVPEPVLELTFESDKVTAPTGAVEFTGPHSFETQDGRRVLRTNGGLVVPYGDALAVKDAFTVAVSFRQLEATQIPVLVCQGAWQGPGYFVQLIGGKLRFYVGGAGFLDCPVKVGLGEWHTVVCVFDGTTLSSYMDSALLGEKAAAGPMQPAKLPFTVARYSSVGPEWVFDGQVDFVRLYDHALEPWAALSPSARAETAITLDWSTADVTVDGRKAVWDQQPSVTDTAHGRAVELKGGLTIPLGYPIAVGGPLTIETSFLLHSTDGMPVLINQGLWPGEGMMLQVLDGRLRFHLGGVGSLDCGPEIEADRWYSVKCSYDGKALRTYIDGEPAGQMTSSKVMVPSARPLRIGRYETSEAVYVANGLMGRTRIVAGPRR